MPVMQDRRRFLATLSFTAAAGLLDVPNVLGQEAPLETTRIRLYDWTGLCIAPQFVAEELLKAEGFTDVQYVRDEPTGQLPNPLLASGAVDINSQFSAPSILRIEAGDPVVFLGGMHVGLLRAIRDRTNSRRSRSQGKACCDPSIRLAAPRLPRQHGGLCRARPEPRHQFRDVPREPVHATARRQQDRRLVEFSTGPAGAAGEEDRPRDRQQLRRPALVAILLLHDLSESRVRPQPSRGDQASDAGVVESGGRVSHGARARRSNRG